MRLTFAIQLSLLALLISGCSEDSAKGTELEATCTGFGSPHINIVVKDSVTRDASIHNAMVQVISEDETQNVASEAVFVSVYDEVGTVIGGSYNSPLSLNSQNYVISISVFADGYHPHVTRGIEFSVDTSCGAENRVNYQAYLCPIGTSCV